MKNKFYRSLLTLALLAGSAVTALAQAGSVDLKDGSGTVISTHASVGMAYAAIPATLTQAYFIELKSSYTSSSESYPIIMTAKAGASAANTITIRPAAGVSSVTMSGTTGSSSALIKLDDADWINIDGRPGGIGTTRALTLDQQGTSSTAYGIWMINGACNNNIRWCHFNGYTSGSSGNKCIYINTSASNPSGNSNNSFEHLKFTGARYYINASGTAANRNNNLRVYGCEFENINFAGFWAMTGTGHTTIDSNFFYSTGPSGTSSTGVFGILWDSMLDTAIITRNKFYNMDNSSYTTTVFGISFRSFVAGSSYAFIANNFMALTAPNPGSKSVIGIEFGTNSANNPLIADVHFNSFYIGGASTGGTAGALNSAAFSFKYTNAGNQIHLSNNLIKNDRSGGVGQHMGTYFNTNSGAYNLHDNTYDIGSGNLARVLGTLYTTMPAYQAAISSEVNSNTATINYVSATDLHLTGASIGDPLLAGTIVSGITTDIDGTFRSLPYRGAHEASPPIPCTGMPLAAVISGATTPPCAGASFTLTATGMSAGMGISYYWQSRPAGSSGAWTNISGATTPSLTTSTTTAMEYRFMDSCAGSMLAAPSNVITINPSPLPAVAAITETHSLLSYSFNATGVTGADTYLWDFGDGATGTGAAATHTYTSPGAYTVSLIVSNSCGADTATLNVSASGCAGTPVSQEIFASDTLVCAGELVMLTVVWDPVELIAADYLDVQWQMSADGTAWTDVPGAIYDSVYANVTDNYYYRYKLTCSAGGLSQISQSVHVSVQPPASVAGIGQSHTGGAYTFTATAPQHVGTYIWNFGEGTPSVTGTATETYTYSSSGTYTVTLIVTGACGNDTVTTTVTPSLSVGALAAQNNITLYPNPATGSTTISAKGTRIQRVQLLNVQGALLLDDQAPQADQYKLNLSAWPAGSYLIRLQTSSGPVSLPLQKW